MRDEPRQAGWVIWASQAVALLRTKIKQEQGKKGATLVSVNKLLPFSSLLFDLTVNPVANLRSPVRRAWIPVNTLRREFVGRMRLS